MLIANQCRVRADDSHPIYDGVTGERINPSRSISIGDHVWIGGGFRDAWLCDRQRVRGRGTKCGH